MAAPPAAGPAPAAPAAPPPAAPPGPSPPPAGAGSGGWLLGAGPPGGAARVLVGAFRRRPGADAALVSARGLQLLADAGAGRLALAATHAAPAAVRDARTVPRPDLDQVLPPGGGGPMHACMDTAWGGGGGGVARPGRGPAPPTAHHQLTPHHAITTTTTPRHRT
jgi:hypothetical protein